MLARLILSVLLAVNLVAVQTVSAANPPSPAGRAASDRSPANAAPLEAKIGLWGILVNAVASTVFSAFKNWLFNRLTGGMFEAGAPLAQQPPVSDSAAAPPQTLGDLRFEMQNAVITSVSEAAVSRMTGLLDSLFSAKSGPVVAEPKTAFSVKSGTPNYQAVHIAVVGATRDGRLTGFRPVNEGFRTGERFKLRVVATYDGMLTIANINPRDERKHIYPPARDSVVSLQAGKETFIPLGPDEFFEFSGTTGTEQLVVTVVDPRALGDGKASRHQVYRQDEPYGSNFAQQVEADTHPVISQAISLLHF